MKKTIGIILKLLLCVLIAAAAYFIIKPLTEVHKPGNPDVNNTNWMAGIPDDRSISDIWIPGTHDSGTQYSALPYFSKCQASSVRTQLEDGFRYLDIRLGIKDERLVFWHGFCLCRTGFLPWSSPLALSDVLAECYDFLAKNPSETIIFAVKVEHGEGGEAFQQLLHNEINKDKTHWLLSDGRIPTLGECRGKLVLMRRYPNTLKTAESGIPLIWADQGGKYNELEAGTAVEPNGSFMLVVQDRYKYGTEDKWNTFLEGLKVSSGQEQELRLHFLSTNGTPAYGHPYTYARELNAKLLKASFDGCKPAWVIVDFSNEALAEHILRMNGQ